MLSIKEIDKIVYYVNQCEINNLNVRDLRSKIKSQEYERVPKDTRNKIIKKSNINKK